MASLAPRYAHLRELLARLTPEAVAASRDVAMRCVAELESINTSLEAELRAKERDLRGLEERDRKAGELQVTN